VDDAAYWAMELLEDYPAYLWRRLKVMLSEDIGVAEPNLPATIHALHETHLEQRKQKGDAAGGAMPTMHAVVLLARARKSRLVYNALIVHGGSARETYREPPDHALDRHTKRGRQLGRGWSHFWSEGAMLADPETGELTAEGSIPDPSLERARQILS
jgi:replication-associated recombination protein RarA